MQITSYNPHLGVLRSEHCRANTAQSNSGRREADLVKTSTRNWQKTFVRQVDPPASAKDAYPISGLTFLIIPVKAKTPEKAKVVEEFVKYIITNGQSEAASSSYAELPAGLQQHDKSLLTQLEAQEGYQVAKATEQ